MRKLCLTPAIVAGGFRLAGAFALDYPAKTQAVDDLPRALRSAFTETGIGHANTDIASAKSLASDPQTKAVPPLAQQRGVTTAGLPTTAVTGQLALPAGALIEAGAACASATGRPRNVEPIEIAPSEPALVA
jgi:hypothetical protein